MKQIELTDTITQKLKAAAGDGVDLSNLAVFKASAINTLPVRKKHPVFYKGVHTRSFLEQMYKAMTEESLPLQIMHDGEGLPSGRVFDGEVVDLGSHSELQVLFWVDKTVAQGQNYINLINNGTVDQVSVSVLAKKAISNKTGFDFMGNTVTMENIWGGVDDKGNKMGEGDSYVLMPELDRWYEMSLVGQGGIQGAKIHSTTGHLKLAASGLDVPPLTLTLSSEKEKTEEDNIMDLAPLITELSDTKAKLTVTEGKLAEAEARATAAETKVTEMTSQMSSVTETTEKLTASEASVATLTENLNGLFTHVAAMTGATGAQPPAEVEQLVSATKENLGKLKLTGNQNRQTTFGSEHGSGEDRRVAPLSNSAFKRPR